MKMTKCLGFLAMVSGALLVACAAALPLAVDRGDVGVVPVRFRVDGCGPAIYAAVRGSDPQCERMARRRLLVTTTAGLVMAVVGLVLLAGGDGRHSRVDVPAGTVRRRPPGRDPDRGRYHPG